MYSLIHVIGFCTLSAYAAPVGLLDKSVPPSLDFQVATQGLVDVEYDWTTGYVSDYTIHSSCNATERHEITKGLEEAVTLATHAKEHILVHGNKSEIFRKYFSAGSAGAVTGWFDKIATSNRAGIIFRCDDPDQNCATQDAWAGHHRGSNASSETVICPLSYTTRLPLSALCARGFDVATGRPADYWGPDLIHRLYHVDLVGEGVIDHHADGYQGCIDLAKGENYTLAATNSATLSYFATEVYAFDISVPGEGCLGKPSEEHDEHDHEPASSPTTVVEVSSTIVGSSTSTSISPTRVIPASSSTSEASPTESGGQECHSHEDGTVHCV